MTHVKQEWMDFAKLAAENFTKHPKNNTFTKGNIEAGCLFAVRWGLGDDCVLVFQLDFMYEPLIFTQIIKEEKQ